MRRELSHATVINDNVARLLEQAPDLASARRAVREAAVGRIAKTVPDDIGHEPFDLGGVRGEVISPPYATDRRIVLYVHGDAWTYGSAEESREVAARIARSSHSRVYTVDFRLAPEHPFPAGLDDVLAAYQALVKGGSDPREIGFVAESTGASLVLGALLTAKRQGLPLPGGVVLTSPVTDLTIEAQGDEGPGWAAICQAIPGYLGGARRDDPMVSPAGAELDGLPPMLLQVGSADPALEQTRRLASRLESARVRVDLRVWDGMIHRWQTFPHIYDAGRATSLAGEFLLQRIGAGSVPVASS